jgi:arabinan endo-1,5-alpha-L-arabinosidase
MEKGTWTDRGATGVKSDASKPYNAIDANLVTDAAGNNLLTFGSFWGDIYQVPMNKAATAAAGSSYNIAYNATLPHALEGAFIHPRAGYYYLFFSSGACCGYDTNLPSRGDEYKIFVCRSQSASGPFVDRGGKSCRNGGGTLVLASHGDVFGPGGQGVLEDKRGSVLYYHYADRRVGMGDGEYRFGWNVLGWKDGWPSV